jgi:hypothetical protein
MGVMSASILYSSRTQGLGSPPFFQSDHALGKVIVFPHAHADVEDGPGGAQAD